MPLLYSPHQLLAQAGRLGHGVMAGTGWGKNLEHLLKLESTSSCNSPLFPGWGAQEQAVMASFHVLPKDSACTDKALSCCITEACGHV